MGHPLLSDTGATADEPGPLSASEWVHLLLATLVAAAMRLPGLATLGFYGDEELSGFAVRGLLGDGFPHMPSGMPYWRGLPYTLAASASSMLLGLSELSLRLPSALSGTLTVGLTYLLARRLAGVRVAVLAAWLLALSGWHINMSREARMYAMFLLAFVLSLIVFLRAVKRPRWPELSFFVATAVVTFMLHELGVMLFLFSGLAILYRPRNVKRKMTFFVIFLALAGFWWVYQRSTQLVFPVGDGSSRAVEEAGGLELIDLLHLSFVPNFVLLTQVLEQHPWIFFAAAAAMLAAAWYTSRSVPPRSSPRWLVSLACMVAASLAALNLFGALLSVLAAVFLLRPGIGRSLLPRPWFLRLLILSAVAFVVWFSYGMAAACGSSLSCMTQWAIAKAVVKDIVYYPALHITVYAEAFFAMTLVVVAGTALWALGQRSVQPPSEWGGLVYTWFWLPLLMLGLTREWISLRYSLPLYPMFLVVFGCTVFNVVDLAARVVPFPTVRSSGKGFLATGLVTAVLVLLPVANEHHGVRAALFWSRLDYGTEIERRLHGYYFHPDHRGAGLFVKTRLRHDDIVVAMDAQEQLYYVGRVDFWLRSARDAAYFSYPDQASRRCIYTDAVVVDSVEALRAIVGERGHRRVWVITSGELVGRLSGLVPPGVDDQFREWEPHRAYTARDSVTSAYLFE